MPLKPSPYTAGRFTLELDQEKSVGWLTSVDGGQLKSGAVDSQRGFNGLVSRYAGRPSYDDITITCGAALSNEFWKWVQASLDAKPERRNGAIVAYDFDQHERSRRTFTAALISEIGFPQLDAASRTAAAFTIKISPETIAYKAGDGSSMLNQNSNDEVSKQKRWLASHFEVVIDRFKSDSRMRNCKVEAFTVKQNIIADPVGSMLVARKQPGRLEMPQLVLTFPEHAAGLWSEWFQKAVVEGNRKDQFTSGHISYLGTDLKTELMRVDFDGLSLLSLEFDKLEAHKEAVFSCKATMNVESLKLNTGSGTV